MIADELKIVALLGIIGIAGGLRLFTWWFSDERVAKRRLRGAKRVDIASVRDGQLVKISGRLELYAPALQAPLTGRPCAFFETLLEEYSGGKHKRWRVRVRESDAREFLVVDGTGKALIETASLRVAVVRDGHRRSGFLNDATPELEAYLARHGLTSVGLLGFNRELRVREGVLEPGEEVTVFGRARWEMVPTATDAGNYRGGAKRLVIEAPGDGEPTIASDDPSTLG